MGVGLTAGSQGKCGGVVAEPAGGPILMPAAESDGQLRRRRIELRVLRVEPGLMIVGILYRQCRLGHLEWTKGVHHNGQLLGILGPDACLRAPRMRAVGNPVRMMGDAAELDSFTAHE